MPTPVELFVEGVTETLPTSTVILTFKSVTSGTVIGTVIAPAGSEAVIVRFRRRNETGYATTNYIIADDSTDVTDSLGRVIREFTITGLVPGAVYGIVAQAVNATLVAISIPSPELLVCVAGAPYDRGSYLPIDVLEYTEFPKPNSKDILQQIRMIEDLWKHQMPQVEYYNIKKAPTPPLNVDDEVDKNVLSGEDGTTKFDPLWGESVPDSVAATGEWAQPHGNDAHSVNTREKYESVVLLHAKVQREAKERQLKKWGFDEMRDLVLTIPVSLLDRFGVKVEPGDQFVWDGERYTVLQKRRDGYFFNSNVRLYVVIMAEHYREGS